MKEERFPRTRKPLRGQRLWVAEGGSFGATEESAATGVRRAKHRDSRTEEQCRAALTSPRGLSARPLGWAGLGAEARASGRLQGEDWGWRREHSLKGLVHHSWLGGRPGKSQELPKRQETFSSLFVSWCARRGDSGRRLNKLQRWAQAVAISADPTATGAQRKNGEILAQRLSAQQHSGAREPCLLTRRGGQGWELRLSFGRMAGRGLGLAA